MNLQRFRQSQWPFCSVKRRSPLAAYGYAKRKGVDNSHVSPTAHPTTLAPDIVEEIARGRQPAGLALLFFVENRLPDDWNEQRRVIGGLAK